MKLFRDRYCPVSSPVPEIRHEQCEALLELRRALGACLLMDIKKADQAEVVQSLIDAYRRWRDCHRSGDPVSFRLIEMLRGMFAETDGMKVDRDMLRHEPLRVNDLSSAATMLNAFLDDWM